MDRVTGVNAVPGKGFALDPSLGRGKIWKIDYKHGPYAGVAVSVEVRPRRDHAVLRGAQVIPMRFDMFWPLFRSVRRADIVYQVPHSIDLNIFLKRRCRFRGASAPFAFE